MQAKLYYVYYLLQVEVMVNEKENAKKKDDLEVEIHSFRIQVITDINQTQL